ncbi:hypothetical protein CEXT_621051 [Caerostris extrusa]|uniref:Uncharacterized protein n=1 Tax=Caerostris extrusa TaxID=172846 RepID=A0AAV4TU76_CAEEX|nr:hypothetical protein CEXT_621051 [Caerostris extrusa]
MLFRGFEDAPFRTLFTISIWGRGYENASLHYEVPSNFVVRKYDKFEGTCGGAAYTTYFKEAHLPKDMETVTYTSLKGFLCNTPAFSDESEF